MGQGYGGVGMSELVCRLTGAELTSQEGCQSTTQRVGRNLEIQFGTCGPQGTAQIGRRYVCTSAGGQYGAVIFRPVLNQRDDDEVR